MMLNGKVAIVTGAGQGIGKATALTLAKQGADIVLADINEVTLGQTRSEVEELGRKAIAVPTDVTKWEAVEQLVELAIAELQKVDVLVNAVGWDIIQPFWENTLEYWDKVIDLNYKSVVYCSKAVLLKMMGNGGGKIVNISSDAGRVGSLGETVYAGAKGGVIAFTKSLARETARYNINVNCVCPGPTDTPLYRGQPEKNRQALERAIPFRRVAKPEEIANAVLFFASGLSDYVTGQVLSVSGGLTMVG